MLVLIKSILCILYNKYFELKFIKIVTILTIRSLQFCTCQVVHKMNSLLCQDRVVYNIHNSI